MQRPSDIFQNVKKDQLKRSVVSVSSESSKIHLFRAGEMDFNMGGGGGGGVGGAEVS